MASSETAGPRTWLHRWARDAILLRPLLFIAAGLLLAVAVLAVDAVVGEEAVPRWLTFPPETARPLLVTLAGATLTLAGITFWVRAASVQLAASQYSPRVVHGFLQDWFQQSMMGLLVGFFAYIVAVLRVVPVSGTGGAAEAAGAVSPHLAVLGAVLLAGGGVLAVLVAIRNSVRSMQAGELARRITDRTIGAVQRSYPRGAMPGSANRSQVPQGRGHVVRARDSGWVQHVDEERVRSVLPAGCAVRIEVRAGLFVVRGRPLVTVWCDEAPPGPAVRTIQDAIHLGRQQASGEQVQDGINQLVDVAMGSLSHAADTSSAYEVIVHIEMVLRELADRKLPPGASSDDEGRWVMRPRVYTFTDYVGDAYDRLRLAAAPYPTVAVALLESLGGIVVDLEEGSHPDGAERADAFRRQGRLLYAACTSHDHVPEDLELIRSVAARHRILEPQWG